MKATIKNLVILSAFLVITGTALAQGQGNPPRPPPGHGYGNNQRPHDGPLGSGLGILVALGLAYGGKKVYDARKDFGK